MQWRFLVGLILGIGAIAPAGCSSTRVECSCAASTFQVSSGVPITGLVASGAACSALPYCFRPLAGGQCDLFVVPLTAAGNCHVAASAADGRQAQFDETVTALGGCCNAYRSNDEQISLFPPIDAGPAPVDAADDTHGPDVVDSGTSTSVPLPPDPTGWVDRTATGTTNIQGQWYGFADGFGADGTPASGACELAGHAPADCSYLTTPSAGGFPNTNGRMCTAGVAARVANVVGGTNPDYNAFTGAGIAFTFNLADMSGTPLAYNATANGVSGIAFDIDTIPTYGLRIQFPTADAVNPAFWDGVNSPISPVVAGHNEVRWKNVVGPFYDFNPPAFDPTMVVRVEFLVPTTAQTATPFLFCVSNLSALLQ